ncbi:MAG: hypothetical protein FWG80_03810 [Alphaproteobacteria bacterium]|nr:hypothetical protein [Alphaproteobacteria bacterium]
MEFFEIALAVMLIVLAVSMISLSVSARASQRIKAMELLLARQSAVLVKTQGIYRARAAAEIIAQNADMLYQDLLQHILPITRALEIQPRDTAEHPLWQTLGGMVDEYAKNPYVLENLRKMIKLDPDTARSADAFLTRAEKLLRHLSDNDPDGLLASAFADGLLGQIVTLLFQAKQLAKDN